MKPNTAKRALIGMPKETSQVVARSASILDLAPIFGLVCFPSSHEHGADSGALPANQTSTSVSLQPPSPAATPQDHVTFTSGEGDSHPVGGGSPRGVYRATSGICIYPHLSVILTGLTSS